MSSQSRSESRISAKASRRPKSRLQPAWTSLNFEWKFNTELKFEIYRLKSGVSADYESSKTSSVYKIVLYISGLYLFVITATAKYRLYWVKGHRFQIINWCEMTIDAIEWRFEWISVSFSERERCVQLGDKWLGIVTLDLLLLVFFLQWIYLFKVKNMKYEKPFRYNVSS